MKTPLRTLSAVALVLAAALVGPACSSITPQALVVDDWSLAEQDFRDEVEAVVANGAYLTQPPAGTDPEPDTYSTALTSQLLNLRVTMVLAEQENERRGLEVTESVRAEAERLLTQGFGRDPVSGGQRDGEAVLDALPQGYQQTLVEGVANIVVLQPDIVEQAETGEGLRELYEELSTGSFERACVRHILLQAGDGQGGAPSEADLEAALEEAEMVVDDLDGGAEFAEVAEERSDDPGSAAEGGDLGCQPRGGYVPEFEAAVWEQPVGEVGEPVRTDFGYHVILVESRGKPPFEDVQAELEQAAEQSPDAVINLWFVGAGQAADVWVNPTFGRWAPEAGQVVAPEGAQTPAAAGLDQGVTGLLGAAG